MLETNPRITGLIITLNEEKNIREVIENISFVDEIIIVDSFSTDKTVEIAKSYDKVKVFQNKFENFTDQRNLALDYASNNWVLFLDADERITPKLKQEIFETIRQRDTAEAYYFYRKFMYKGKPLHFSGWQTDKNIRLFKKDAAQYSKERLVHEILRVKGRTRVMKHKLIHYSYLDYASYKQKMEKYAKLKAKELYMKEVKPNIFHFYVKPAYKFFYKYIVRLGILDGRKGLTICYLNAYSVYSRYPYLNKLYQENKK
jgi:glycosyltransferase involved in cell wall biosynthesis